VGEHGAAWQLDNESCAAIPATQLELEVTVDRSVEAAASELQRSAALSGCLIYVPKGQQLDALSVDVGGQSYRVRKLSPAPSAASDAIYQVTPSTQLSLFSSGLRTPVDIVVLADISGSMNAQDVTESEELIEVEKSSFWGLRKHKELVKRTKRMTRMAAVKQALHNLLAIRMTSPGRVSRIAVVAFDHECRVCFPLGGGMTELDESSPPELVDEYRKAVALLRPDRGATNIGRALHFAGELLAKHSAPGNDRLIVLISDGADWHRQGDDATGEMVYCTAEPVSLLEELALHMGVRLQALGVSSMDLFEPWWKETFPGKPYDTPIVPNHELLAALIQVGGGDPGRIGDTDVLLEYFEGLGKGITRSLAAAPARPAPQLSSEERVYLQRLSQSWQEREHERARQTRLVAVAKEIVDLFWTSNELSADLADRPLFQLTRIGDSGLGGWLHRYVDSRASFEQWWPKVHQLFFEARDPKTKPTSDAKGKTGGRGPASEARRGDYCVAEVRDLLLAQRASDLNHLRNWISHDFAVGEVKSRERVAKILMRLTGKSFLQADDEAGWHALQLRALEELRDLMSEVVAAFAQAHAAKAQAKLVRGPAAPSAAPPAAPTFLFLEAPPL
ncbi:MAG TPA: vWA domain-containing protein, partial [Polyangiaceae bacterium]|nr:vWA domain-containing protein [Polyangiaceae bacterium]